MKGWRTIGINVLIAVCTVLVAANWADVLPAQYAWGGLVITNVLNIVMRYFTNTPIGQSS